MDVATFLAKADALQKKGMMALMSSDYKLLKAEIDDPVAARFAAERLAAERAGRKRRLLPAAPSGAQQRRDPRRLPHHPRRAAPANPGQGRASRPARPQISPAAPDPQPSTPSASSRAKNRPAAMKAKLSRTKVRHKALQRDSW